MRKVADERTVRFAPINTVILFGGAPLLVATARELRTRGVDTHVFTSPRHVREVLDAHGTTLAAALENEGISPVVTEDINECPALEPLIGERTLGLGMGEAWSFGKRLIDRFGGRLLDMMGIPLPRYRGGAHYTWMILRGDRDGACNLQIINEDMVQGERDTGAIVKTRRYRFPETATTPLDYFNAAVAEELALILEFLEETIAGKEFSLTSLDESQSLFFPRLNTMVHGWIDWGADGRDIARFICAFDNPYAGASTLLDGARVHLKHVSLDHAEPPFHPFQCGLITRITSTEGIVVATRSGHLRIGSLTPSPGTTLPRPPQPGDRFVTPREMLDRALSAHVSYGAQS